MKYLKYSPPIAVYAEILVFCFVVGLQLFLLIDTNYVNVLYLCGDVTREASRAYWFLQNGTIHHNYSYPFEADLFCLSFLPFLVFFKNSVLAVQIGGIALGTLTITVLYLFIRRTYGLMAGLFVGSIYAVSPLLLGHSMLSPIFEVPLWIAIVLLLETFTGRAIGYISIFAAGMFTAFSPYFVFPYFGYILGRLLGGGGIQRATFRKIILALSVYLLGWSVFYLPKFLSNPAHLANTTAFLNGLLATNAERAQNLPALIKNFGVQLTWSLYSILRYGASKESAMTTWIVYLWGISMFVAVFFKDSRRWVITLAFGFLPACFISSGVSASGIGMRHFLAFLPFYWLIYAPAISNIKWENGKLGFCLVALVVTTEYFLLARLALIIPQNVAFAEVILRDAEYMKHFFSLCPRKYIFIREYDKNLFSGLTYLVPEKKTVSISEAKQGEYGAIYLCKESDPERVQNRKYLNLGYVYAIGGGGRPYAVMYEL